MYMKKIYYVAFLLSAVLGYGLVAAEAQVTGTVVATAPSCLLLEADMHVGSTDISVDGSVTKLQTFLTEQGYFNSVNLGTGNFGPLTRAAVVAYQSAHELPMTGYVGPLTRASISSVSKCDTGTTPSTGNGTPITIFSISPTSEKVGNVVTITGFGFTANNTVLIDGLVAAQNVPITSSIAVACTTDPACIPGIRQTVSFRIPPTLAPNCSAGSFCAQFLRSVIPGKYLLSVQNANGTQSKYVTLTVNP